MPLLALKQNIEDALDIEPDIYLSTANKRLIEQEITAHEVLLHRLLERIAALKNHRNSLSSAWRLPVEVLTRIMFAATEMSIKENNEAEVYPNTLPVPLALGQVCTAWRELAWSVPELWATIPLAIDKSRYSRQAALLDEWLDRAGERQDLYIIITLSKDESELQYWRDYPPKEILSRLYRRSNQWHTFYSTVPNLCFDLFGSVHRKLSRLHTLILHRSGRFPFEFQGGLHNLGNAVQITVPGAVVNVNNGGAVPAATIQQQVQQQIQQQIQVQQPQGPLGGINLDDDLIRQRSPWYMLSEAPSLRTVILPDALNPSDISLPWSQLVHLEVRTIPIDDCLRVLQLTPRIVSFDFHGIFSGPLTFLPTPHLHLKHLEKVSVFSDPTNLGRFFDALTTQKLDSLEFKSTTGALTPVNAHLVQMVQRSDCRLRRLKVCVPSIGRSEEQIVNCLLREEFRWVEELGLESWQANVEGLSDLFWRKMNPERRVRSVRTYSYPVEPASLGGVLYGSPTGSGSWSGSGSSASSGSGGSIAATAGSWLDGPTDEIREVVEHEVEIPEGEYTEPQEILLPNLSVMTYKGALSSFTPQALKDTLLARWKRKSRKRTIPQLVSLTNPNGGEQEGDVWVFDEEGEWYPTAEMTACEIVAPEEVEFKEPMSEETRLAFRWMLREGFCLSVETKAGVLAF